MYFGRSINLLSSISIFASVSFKVNVSYIEVGFFFTESYPKKLKLHEKGLIGNL